MKVVTVLGARPQFIKAAVVSKVLREYSDEIIIHTGQHYDDNMSQIFFDELEIAKPNYNLNIGSGNHGYQTGRMLIDIEEVLLKEKPELVLVYGDTNSTIAGALAASKLLIPVVHIEAGLRSFNLNMPEEQNRILADHISRYLFTPTETAVTNLNKEGISKNVFNVGDVMYDSTLQFRKVSEKKSKILSLLNLENKEYILVTMHRAENTDNPNRLKSIVKAINLSKETVILPLHPRTKKFFNTYGLTFNDNVRLIEPVGYLDMLMLEGNSKKIVTDSGGIQKEAFFLEKPCITLRDETEWVETVSNGWNILASANTNDIISAINGFVPTKEKINYFGDGNSSEKIVQVLAKDFK